MSAIVVNTLNGAVTEYTGFAFQSVTPTHGGTHLGLYSLGGDTDFGTPIVARITTGRVLWSTSLKKMLDAVYFALRSTVKGKGRLLVTTPKTTYSYPFGFDVDGVSRAYPGKGIRENYLAFGFTNPDGDDFELDRIELMVAESKTRRI